jgi:hypothetical protein
MASNRPKLASDFVGAAGAAQGPAQDEAALVDRAQRGDARALRELYDRYRPRVHAVASTVASLDAEAIQGVVRESFVRAFRRLPRGAEAGSFGPRLLAVARRRTLWSGGKLAARGQGSTGPAEGNDIEFARIRRAAQLRPLRGRWVAAACAAGLLLLAGGMAWRLARSSSVVASGAQAQGPASPESLLTSPGPTR